MRETIKILMTYLIIGMITGFGASLAIRILPLQSVQRVELMVCLPNDMTKLECKNLNDVTTKDKPEEIKI